MAEMAHATRNEGQNSRADQPSQEQFPERDADHEPIVPRLFSAPEAPKHELVPSAGEDHPTDEN
jgi:hypothetical protein